MLAGTVQAVVRDQLGDCCEVQGTTAYQGDQVAEQMRLAAHHPRHSLVIDMHHVHVEVIYSLEPRNRA